MLFFSLLFPLLLLNSHMQIKWINQVFMLQFRNGLKVKQAPAVQWTSEMEKTRCGTCDVGAWHYRSLHRTGTMKGWIGKPLLFRSGRHAYDCCHATFDNVAMVIAIAAERETESRSVTMAEAGFSAEHSGRKRGSVCVTVWAWHVSGHLPQFLQGVCDTLHLLGLNSYLDSFLAR